VPLNSLPTDKIEAWNPTKEDSDLLLRLNERIQFLKDQRKRIMANPYDVAKDARNMEETWDFCDHVALPHKYSNIELKKWQARNSRPLIYSKIDTALSILFERNPEVELSARQDKYEGKTALLTALYNLSWDKGHGQQQLIKFIQNCAKYGTAVGREYHRFETQEIDEVVDYDPVNNKHVYEKKTIAKHDEAYFEVLPIRDCWFDDRAKPYDEDSIRDWCWEQTYDYSTFLNKFGKMPGAKFVEPGYGKNNRDPIDKADTADDSRKGPQVRLTFYENTEDNEFIITDKHVIIYKAPLINCTLSCVVAMWKMRNDFTIYGVSLPEILENDQEILDKVANMTVNQTMLAISAPGFYGGAGTVTEKDMQLEPKLKKLRDAEKIVFAKIPGPDQTAFSMMEDIRNEADEMSGITKSLGGEQIGNTLGEAVLNREAGLRRLALPLKNVEFALERHARLRIDNLQRIYSRPQEATIIRDTLGTILDQKLWDEYQAGLAQLGPDNLDQIQKFPSDPVTGVVFRNQFKTERLPLQKDTQGAVQYSDQDKLMEITPEEIRGEYDVKVRAMSMIPLSKTLEAQKALETFNIVAQNPYTDLYKATSRLLKKRDEKPDDWLQSKDQIIQQQQAAMQAPPTGTPVPPGQQPTTPEVPQGQMPESGSQSTTPPTILPPNQMTSTGGAGYTGNLISPITQL